MLVTPDKNEAQAIAALTRHADWPVFAAFLARSEQDATRKMSGATDLILIGRTQGAVVTLQSFHDLKSVADSVLKTT